MGWYCIYNFYTIIVLKLYDYFKAFFSNQGRIEPVVILVIYIQWV